jgi:hypothetical protein
MSNYLPEPRYTQDAHDTSATVMYDQLENTLQTTSKSKNSAQSASGGMDFVKDSHASTKLEVVNEEESVRHESNATRDSINNSHYMDTESPKNAPIQTPKKEEVRGKKNELKTQEKAVPQPAAEDKCCCVIF